MPREKNARSNLRYVLVDIGFEPGGDFCHALLKSGDFDVLTLKKFGRGDNRDSLASDVTARLMSGTVSYESLMLAFCRQPRQWLSLKVGRVDRVNVRCGSAREFLTRFGQTGWYGPFVDDEEKVSWYVLATRSSHRLPVDDSVSKKFPVRWHVVAEVRAEYIAFHWNNFTHITAEEGERADQFEYWHHIPPAFDSLADELDARLDTPHLNEILLHRIRKSFRGLVNIRFGDVRVRGERDGLSLTAHSGRISELSIAGLQALSSVLAKTALQTLNLDVPDEQLLKLDDALLDTLIYHWGTKSYECSIEEGSSKIFRAHCYFGVRENSGGGARNADSLPHLHCYKEFGGSRSALKFLLRFILS